MENKPERLNVRLERFSQRVTQWTGSSWAFAFALGFVLVWAISGPAFGFSAGWQLVINTGTTIATFLMVFLIQRAQNKEGRAIQLKLNEIVASQEGASNRLVGIEDLTEEELSELHKQYLTLAERIQQRSAVLKACSVEDARDRTDEHSAKRGPSVETPGQALRSASRRA